PAPWAFRYGMLYGVACAWAVGPWLPQAMAHYIGLGLPLGAVAGTLYGVAFWGTGFGVFAAGAAVLLGSRGPLASGLAVPALWVATEFVRGRFLGQPWGLLGYTQHAQTALIQIAALTAVYGVSFLLAFGNMAIAESIALLRARADRRRILATLALPGMLAAPLRRAPLRSREDLQQRSTHHRRGAKRWVLRQAAARAGGRGEPVPLLCGLRARRKPQAVQHRLCARGASHLRSNRGLDLP